VRKLLLIVVPLMALVAMACGGGPTPTPIIIEVPVDREVIREVPVDREVIREIEVPRETRVQVIVTATPTPTALPTELDAILEAAAAEGVVEFRWLTPPRGMVSTWQAAFFQRFGFPVDIQTTVQHPVRASLSLSQEFQAGKMTNDIYQGSSPLNRGPYKAGAMQSVDWMGTFGPLFDDRGQQKLQALTDEIEPDIADACLPFYHVAYPIGYNTDKVSADEVPDTFEGLLDAKWENKVSWQDGGFPMGTMGLSWGRERTVAFAKGLKDNGVIIGVGGGSSAVVQSVVTGEASLGVASYNNWLELIADGAPVNFKFVSNDITPYFMLNFCALAGSHPNMAQLFIVWSTVEGRDLIAGSPAYRARIDDKAGPLGEVLKAQKVDLSKFITWADAEGGALRTSIRLEAVKEFTN